MGGEILNGEELRKQLELILPNRNEIKIISAYVTKPAIEWLASVVQLQDIKITIVARVSVSDIVNLSTDLNALNLAISSGWTVRCLPNLHAKITLVDDREIFVGSANFTSNGLKIVGTGNVEASLRMTPDTKSIAFVDEVIKSSALLSKEIIQRMKEYLKVEKKNVGIDSTWPEVILPEINSLQVNDFPLTKPGVFHDLYLSNPYLTFSVIENTKSHADAVNLFLNSKAYKWLVKVLNLSDGRCAYYGYVSSVLHEELIDDPAPYRSTIKELLSNLLSYIELFANENIDITRPKYSQRICLRGING